ncbi:STAS domain-containing protein [Thalassobacillus sp. C254]|uniref:STAS domain-containing protein n=1 Tax=Thalassobacillus sp. C254 TaxID=1225341 RepID=UPI0006CF9784|nr:STAS domain-containing protein [Thalassobacillus sp. C254]
MEYHEKKFIEAKGELIELSVPIVPITKDVAILPLVGTLDTYRTQELMEKTLKSGSDLGLTYLVIDLSGVHMIDTAVAQNLFQLREALQLLGITGIMAGVRPELAQTMVP